jgi:hypothetical protein
VIGCSGRASFLHEDVRFVEDGAYLASASSGPVELSRDAIFALANGTAQPAVFVYGNKPLGQRGVHSDVRVHLFDRDVVISTAGSRSTLTAASTGPQATPSSSLVRS